VQIGGRVQDFVVQNDLVCSRERFRKLIASQ